MTENRIAHTDPATGTEFTVQDSPGARLDDLVQMRYPSESEWAYGEPMTVDMFIVRSARSASGSGVQILVAGRQVAWIVDGCDEPEPGSRLPTEAVQGLVLLYCTWQIT